MNFSSMLVPIAVGGAVPRGRQAGDALQTAHLGVEAPAGDEPVAGAAPFPNVGGRALSPDYPRRITP